MVRYGVGGLISIIREVKDIYDKYYEDDNETKIKNAERSLKNINDTYKVLLRKVEPEIEDLLTPKYLKENFSPEYIDAITKSINDLVSSQKEYFSDRSKKMSYPNVSRGGKRSKRKTNKKYRKHRKSRKTRK